jgi:hypothetical protein
MTPAVEARTPTSPRQTDCPRVAPPETTRATYQLYTDSGGAIPKFIKENGSQIGIRKLFAAIRKQVRDPKYAEKN